MTIKGITRTGGLIATVAATLLAAGGVDRALTGTSELPAPIRPTDRALMV